MHRCFLEERVPDSATITICGDEANHIIKVLRYKVGDEFEICDNSGYVYVASVMKIEGKTLTAEIKSKYISNNEPSIKVIAFQGLSKGTKMELVIQKCVELGVSEIVPVQMEYSVVKFKEDGLKSERWQRVATEAAKQCKRAIVPTVKKPVAFSEAIKMMKSLDLALLPYECEREGSLKKFLKSNLTAESIGYIVGPEGGFSNDEIQLADREKIYKVTLGNRILRTETASFTMLSVIMYELGELDKKTGEV